MHGVFVSLEVLRSARQSLATILRMGRMRPYLKPPMPPRFSFFCLRDFFRAMRNLP